MATFYDLLAARTKVERLKELLAGTLSEHRPRFEAELEKAEAELRRLEKEASAK
jgi:hypothetical protein